MLEQWALFISQSVGAVPVAPSRIMLISSSTENGIHSKKVKLSHQPLRQILINAFKFQMAHHSVFAYSTQHSRVSKLTFLDMIARSLGTFLFKLWRREIILWYKYFWIHSLAPERTYFLTPYCRIFAKTKCIWMCNSKHLTCSLLMWLGERRNRLHSNILLKFSNKNVVLTSNPG